MTTKSDRRASTRCSGCLCEDCIAGSSIDLFVYLHRIDGSHCIEVRRVHIWRSREGCALGSGVKYQVYQILYKCIHPRLFGTQKKPHKVARQGLADVVLFIVLFRVGLDKISDDVLIFGF